MIAIRKSQDRGHFSFGWLDTYHTFSFGEYHDPKQMGFRSLRVINEDRVAPGQGFGMHRHRDMEIITYIVSGALQHKDSMGNGEVLRPGEIQRMTAGRGIAHSEFNPSATEPVHLLQIWILPERNGLEPGYEQKAIPAPNHNGPLRLIASRDGANGSVKINQDANIYAANLSTGQSAAHSLDPGRHAWVQVVRGPISLNGVDLAPGDGAAVSDERRLDIGAANDAELLLFDLG